MFWVVQVTTFAILVLAANTSFQGFPRLAALLARDRFFPRQFANLGDRLVYSNGIVVLSGLAIFLLWHYHASVDSLIHLYVLGVFTAFTLSQIGMVRYWRRTRRAAVAAQRGDQRCSARSRPASCSWSSCRRSSPQGAWLVTVAIPRPRADVPRDQPALPPHVAPAAGGRRGRSPPRRRRARRTLIAVDAIDDSTRAGALVRAGDRRLRLPRSPCSRPRRPTQRSSRAGGSGSGDRPRLELLPVRRGARRVAARVRLERAAQRSRLRQRRRPRAVPQAVTARGCSAGRRSLQLKLRLLKEPGVVITDVPLVAGELPVAERAVGTGARLRRPRRVAARDRLRRHAPARRRPRRLLRVRRRRGPPDAPGLGALSASSSRSTSSRRRSATSATRSAPTCGRSPRTTRSPSSSCPSSSSTAGAGCSTTSARSTSSACCCSSPA